MSQFFLDNQKEHKNGTSSVVGLSHINMGFAATCIHTVLAFISCLIPGVTENNSKNVNTGFPNRGLMVQVASLEPHLVLHLIHPFPSS